MKTVTYNDVLYLAVEMAGRTRDKIPTSEATMLRGFIAAELDILWPSQNWPELCSISSVTFTNRSASKNEGEASEIGDVLGVYSGDPRTTSRIRAVGFYETDDALLIDESLGSAYVESLSPAPDLTAVAADDLAAYALPRRFKKILAFRAAEHLLRADGDQAGAGVMHGLAEAALADEIRRLPPEPWWRRVSVRKEFAGSVTQPAVAA